MKEQIVALGQRLFGPGPPPLKLQLTAEEVKPLFEKADLNAYFSYLLRYGDYAKQDCLTLREWNGLAVAWYRRMFWIAVRLLATLVILGGSLLGLAARDAAPDVVGAAVGFVVVVTGIVTGMFLRTITKGRRKCESEAEIADGIYNVLHTEMELAKGVTMLYPNGIPAQAIEKLWQTSPSLAHWRKINESGGNVGDGLSLVLIASDENQPDRASRPT